MFDVRLDDNNIPFVININHGSIPCDNAKELVQIVNAQLDLSHSFNEQVIAVAHDNAGICDFYRVSTGGRDHAIVDSRALFTALLLRGATSFIIIHNHPSGSCISSRDDNALCVKLQEAARLMDMQLLDFIIIGKNNDYYSFKENGKIS